MISKSVRSQPTGATFSYIAETEDRIEENVVEATNTTEEILGVSCTVVVDLLDMKHVLTEETYHWYAQDNQGNLSYFAE